MQRRQFIKTTAAASAALATAPLIRVVGQDKKYRTALVGAGWWGGNILRCAIQAGQSKIVALCDVDANQLNATAAEVKKLSGETPKLYRDYRELLLKEKPEIVIVATPDHWHPLCAIAAMHIGAHVYVEKPICHTINEGKAMVKAARDTQRIVQVGTHRRASPHNISGMEFLKSGRAGKIGSVRAFVHYGGGPGKKTPDTEPPSTLDWNMWCGPAPLRPFITPCIRADSEVILITRMVSSAIGAFTGWIRYFGGQKKNIRRKCIQQRIVLFGKTIPMRRTLRMLSSSLNRLPPRGSIANTPLTMRKRPTLGVTSMALRVHSTWAGSTAGLFILLTTRSHRSTRIQPLMNPISRT
jgi:hypothetical protein